MHLIFCLTWLLSDHVQSADLLHELKREKNMGWLAGKNQRFDGLTFGDANVISGSAHKLRPDTIPLAPAPKTNISIPASYNFTERFTRCAFGPLDQGRCGSCWAFSVAKSFSHRYCRKHGDLRIFSSRHLAGCDRRNMGCQGGISVPAWRYIDLRGLPLESCLPYDVNATSINCSRKCDNEMDPFEVNKTEFWSVARYGSVEEMQLGIMLEGPVVASMKVYTDFLYYKSGVYSHVKGTFGGYHAIEITGWGVRDGIPFWEISNSWGTKWGLTGSFLIKRGQNECGIEDYVAAGRAI